MSYELSADLSIRLSKLRSQLWGLVDRIRVLIGENQFHQIILCGCGNISWDLSPSLIQALFSVFLGGADCRKVAIDPALDKQTVNILNHLSFECIKSTLSPNSLPLEASIGPVLVVAIHTPHECVRSIVQILSHRDSQSVIVFTPVPSFRTAVEEKRFLGDGYSSLYAMDLTNEETESDSPFGRAFNGLALGMLSSDSCPLDGWVQIL